MPTTEARQLPRKIMRLAILALMYPFAKAYQHNEIPVLAYHSIDDNITCPFSVSVEKFRQQIAYLKISGYQSISLDDLIGYVQGVIQKVGPRKIVLTFDDGFESFDTKVLPILNRYGFSAVLSVVDEFCSSGRTDTYDNGVPAPALSWDEVRRISAEGVEIASHGMSHVKLTTISLKEADREIRRSKERIETILNSKVAVFCYPHGVRTEQITSLVKWNGYKAAMTTNPGLVRKGDDIYRLKRVTLKRDISLTEFKAMLTPAVEWYAGVFWGKIGQAVGLGRVDIF